MKTILFHDEVKNINELVEKISEINDAPELNEVKVGVICFLFDKDGKLVFNRRGPGARDDIGKLQALGGSINGNDPDFRSAMKRELMEEAGIGDASINEFIGAIVDSKYDKNSGKVVDWVILAYKGLVGNDELKNMEPERCVGFEHKSYDEIDYNDMGETAASFVDYLRNSGM